VTASPAPPIDRLSLARALRGTGREFESTVQGASMGSTLPPGSRIRIRCDDADRLAEGQVVALVLDDRLVAHRVVARDRGPAATRYLLTLGDGCVICDAPVPGARILGTVVAREREGAWVPIPDAPRRRGWRGPAAHLFVAVVRVSLALDARLATALVNAALFGQRLKARVRQLG